MSAVRALRPMLLGGPPPRIVPIPTQLALEAERLEATSRMRRSMGASVAFHVLLALWLVLSPRAREDAQAFTEVTLLEPGPPAHSEPVAAPAAQAPRTEAGALAASERDQRFTRSQLHAEVSPVPQEETAFEDRLQARLATLQQGASSPRPGAAEAPIAGVLAGTAARPTSAVVSGVGQHVDLKRGGGDAGPAIALTRGPGLGSSSLAPAALPAGRPSAPAAAREEGSTLRRTLAGAMLAGPVADRPVLSTRTPDYPDWAMRDGVEGSVTLHFIVRADGTVKENILVEKTAGFEDFDESARRALREWRFQPLTGGRTGEQWGNITFHFRIRETG